MVHFVGYFINIKINIILPSIYSFSKSSLFRSFPPKPCMHFVIPYMPYAHPSHLHLTILPSPAISTVTSIL